ncbi:hypothetical protein [Maribellus sp. YY47]|uniref:hypothetical protein n=1 Tax=Maribellus sp. YY47 TaxID=2929486 RepID=UPI00200191C1|nr:hypothetical protein [Maribellus sp. YY47]MCK3685534.1 hypothetical protein [Maribellus sp. YY47]
MKKLSLVSVLIFFLAVALNAQTNVSHNITVTIPSYAMVGLSSTGDITLAPTAPENAGEALDFSSATNNTKYLQYSSILNNGSSSNTISVSMTENGTSLPAGVTIELETAKNSVGGKGNRGTGVDTPVVLSTTEGKEIVTGIKNGYTGTGASGHLLTYSLKMTDTDASYSALTSDNFSVTITYTITAE